MEYIYTRSIQMWACASVFLIIDSQRISVSLSIYLVGQSYLPLSQLHSKRHEFVCFFVSSRVFPFKFEFKVSLFPFWDHDDNRHIHTHSRTHTYTHAVKKRSTKASSGSVPNETTIKQNAKKTTGECCLVGITFDLRAYSRYVYYTHVVVTACTLHTVRLFGFKKETFGICQWTNTFARSV